jgi:hypothetical protein
MTDFRERVFESREENKLKKLASRIPGIGQYMDKEMRREADKLLRVYIADQLEQQRKRLVEYQGELLNVSGGLALMDDVEGVQKKLQLLSDRLRTAVYGYAGWFDSITIRENELNALYDYDTSLLDGVEEVTAAVLSFGEAVSQEGEVKTALKGLRALLVTLHERVDRRRDVLIGAMPVVPEAPVYQEPEEPAEPVEPAEVEEPTPSVVDEDVSPVDEV